MDWKLAYPLSQLLPRRFRVPEVGTTPHDLFLEIGRNRVLSYRARRASKGRVPVLFVPSLVNRHYILDLVPGRSVVEHFLARGVPTYMMDWGAPGPEDATTSLDDLLFDRLATACRKIQNEHGVAPTLVGYCMGGTMSLVFAAQRPSLVSGLVLLATPIDFDKVGLLTLWARHKGLSLDDIVDTWGLVPPSVLQPAFTLLKPAVLTRKWVTLLQFSREPEKLQAYLPMFRWATDNVSIPGAVLKTWTNDYFRKNGLCNGTLVADSRKVNLKELRTPVLNVVALLDHIIETESPRALGPLLDRETDYELLELPMGHTDLTIGAEAGTRVMPAILDWLDRQHPSNDKENP